MSWTLFVLLALAALNAADAFPQPFPVRELYGVRTPAETARMASLGWNTLIVGNREGLDRCRAYGFRGVFSGIPHHSFIFSFNNGAMDQFRIFNHDLDPFFIIELKSFQLFSVILLLGSDKLKWLYMELHDQ